MESSSWPHPEADTASSSATSRTLVPPGRSTALVLSATPLMRLVRC
ncbi:hypothetical protein KYC5002_43580 [Archangium violaceum]|nr:hypothetical protein KYC5002_43580 [Archangium gephyra]